MAVIVGKRHIQQTHAALSDVERQILCTLTGRRDGCTMEALRDRHGYQKDKLRSALIRLEQNNLVSRHKKRQTYSNTRTGEAVAKYQQNLNRADAKK